MWRNAERWSKLCFVFQMKDTETNWPRLSWVTKLSKLWGHHNFRILKNNLLISITKIPTQISEIGFLWCQPAFRDVEECRKRVLKLCFLDGYELCSRRSERGKLWRFSCEIQSSVTHLITFFWMFTSLTRSQHRLHQASRTNFPLLPAKH